MDRKGIAVVGLAVIVFIWWAINYNRDMTRYVEQQRVLREEEALKAPATPAPAPGVPTAALPGAATPGLASAPAVEVTPEKLEKFHTPAVAYTFSTNGGGIVRAELTEHKAEQDMPVEMNRSDAAPIGAISEIAGDGAKLPYAMTSAAGASPIVFERTDARNLKIAKKFTLPQPGATQDSYVTQMEVSFTNQGGQALQIPAYYVYTGAAAPLHQGDLMNYTGLGWHAGGKFTFKDSASFQSGGFLFFGKQDAPLFTLANPETAWAGVTNQYYTSLITPAGQKAAGVWARRYSVPKDQIGHAPPATTTTPPPPPSPSGQTVNAVEGALTLPGFTVAPGATVTHTFQIYTGPREHGRLGKLGAGQEAMMDFGMFRVISKLLLRSMNWLHSFLGTYALAIIVLTIIIRGLMWPLQNKATQSMKNIAALTPKMNELKEKYPDDPQRVQQETMKLYKQYNINPLMGCLPMLVQIPIFFGFFNMLGKAVELRNASFLWVHDLSQPDTVAVLLGLPINILPLLMAGTMFWQMKISPKSGDAMQQRVFMFMPVIFVLFCYNYASALALYWTVQNLFSIVQLYITRDKTEPVLQKVSTTPSKKRS